MENEKIERIVNDLYLFYRGIVAKNFTENVPAPHIKSLSRELMSMYRGDYRRLCVAMPPSACEEFNDITCIPLMAYFP